MSRKSTLTLKDARLSRSIPLSAVANAVGVSRPTYRKFEEDPGLMRIEQAEKACDFMGFKPDDISFFCQRK